MEEDDIMCTSFNLVFNSWDGEKAATDDTAANSVYT